LKHAQRSGVGWALDPLRTLEPAEEIADLAIDLDTGNRPHLVYFVSEGPNNRHAIGYDRWNGTAWENVILDGGEDTTLFREALVAMALDGADNLHAAYYDVGYEDLRYITWAPNWQTRTLPENGLVRSPAVEVQSTLEGTLPHVAYYDQAGGQVTLASWDTEWTLNPLDFVSAPVEAVAMAAGSQYEHASYYDADNRRLMYGYWDGAAWRPEVVDEAGDVGRYNDLLLAGHTDGAPRIAYWDATTLRVKLATPVLNVGLWNLHPNNAGPALNAESGALSAAELEGGDVAVAYYDGQNDDLRLAVWDAATGGWTDELVDGAGVDMGRLNSIQADVTEDGPVVAYLAPGGIRWAYKVGGAWQRQDVPGTDGEAVTGLALELGLDSRERARIAYTTASGGVYVAHRRDGQWQIEVVASSGAAPVSDLSSALDSRLHLAYAQAGGGLAYVVRVATQVVNRSAPLAPQSAYGGGYNPLDPCGHTHSDESGARHETNTALTAAAAVAGVAPGALSDDAIFDAMANVFAATPAGQSFMEQYNQHSGEMGQIGLNDPALLWDAFGTLQNFLPGLEALVAGRGEQMVVTQAMVDDALDIWQRLAAAGSPALAGAINAELARYDNLQDFVGLTFDEWARALGVEPPARVTYLPVIAR
jgi:hypothetical protein